MSSSFNHFLFKFMPFIEIIRFFDLRPIPWMMMGEMLSSDIKSIASSFTVEFNWISVFIITKSFEPMVQTLGSAITFWIFACIMAAGTVYGSACLFETKGKSNTEIQMRLAGKK